ncbi:unnamed protein product [Adineta steineri]|uniref:Uncharacterized protein n=1 Tax=Adineta steineri TaxID=433720 RepID=A0A814T607_9BILA|nr:unnamed protein product [Adineta steineri]CAF1157527.1 unnamed protein product [Adineta steineri]CAF1220474.1 unnamed protein product [Adineta steineri]
MFEDASKREMSQSLEHDIDSLNLIHGCRIDILRFACCDNSTKDQYINLDKSNLEEARTFCDEIWLTGTEKSCDLWILSRLNYSLSRREEFSNHKLFALYLLSKHSVGDEHKYN